MKIERKYMAHYLNAAFGSGDASYTRLGSDLEEYSPELTANVEKKSNIVGETTVTINGYQKQGEVSPYYAEPGDPLFERLQAIIDGDLVLDDLKTDIVEVKLCPRRKKAVVEVRVCRVKAQHPAPVDAEFLHAGVNVQLHRTLLSSKPSPPRGKVAPQRRMRGSLPATALLPVTPA